MDDICEHVEEHREEYAAWPDSEYKYGEWCGDKDIHNPHGGCKGIMCDYGCNAEAF